MTDAIGIMIEILLYGIAFDGVGGDVFLWMVVANIVVETGPY